MTTLEEVLKVTEKMRQNAGIERLMVEALPGPFVAHGKVREGRLESAHGGSGFVKAEVGSHPFGDEAADGLSYL